jgi:hypothetical protein
MTKKKPGSDRIEFRLLVTKDESTKISRAMSQLGIKVIVGDPVDPDTALRHEAATVEAAGILRAAGMNGIVMLNLDRIE